MSKKKATVGYRYFMDLHMGICRGPVDELLAVRVGGRAAWQGRVNTGTYVLLNGTPQQPGRQGWSTTPDDSQAVTSSCTVPISAGNLFGGWPNGEGGISGLMQVMMGESTQVAPAGLTSMLGGLVPGFRGFLSVWFSGMVCAMNPYPKPWAFRVRRTNQGWDGGNVWYPAKAAIWLGSGQSQDGIRAMNPAHILYELWTNKDFGRGLPASRLDLASFQAAADKLYAEGFGLCLAWNRQSSVSDFMQIVMDHIGAVCGPDLSTGLIRLKLIRDDYTPSTLPTFGYESGLLGIDEEQAPSPAAVTNEIIVSWFDPTQKLKRQTPPVQNLGSIQAVGRKQTVRDYPGLPTASLAMRVAQRDLRSSSPAIRRFRVRLDRRGYAVQPGDAFRITAADRSLTELVVRAGRVEEGELTDGTITVTCVQDMFGLPAVAQVAEQVPQPAPVYDVPPVITTSRLVEIPYLELVQTMEPLDLAALDASACFVGTLAAMPSSYASDYLIYSRAGAAAYTFKGDHGDWCATALAVAATPITATPVTVLLTSASKLDTVLVGAQVLWDDEILRVSSVDTTAVSVTLARACGDTVPAPHAANSRLWFFGAAMGRDSTEYLGSEVVSVKLLAETPTNFADPAGVAAAPITMGQRQAKPYAPGAFKLNGNAYPAAILGDLAVSWAHRDRVLQADQLVDTTAASVGPESGTTYTVRVYGNAGTLIHTESGLTGASWTYTQAAETADAGGYQSLLRVTVEASRGGLTSWQKHDYTFNRAGLGLSLGVSLGGI